jgi:hypothetical protein
MRDIIIYFQIHLFLLMLYFYICILEDREELVEEEYELIHFVLLSISSVFFIDGGELMIGLLCIIWWNFQLSTFKLH